VCCRKADLKAYGVLIGQVTLFVECLAGCVGILRGVRASAIGTCGHLVRRNYNEPCP
jgi:hypothetical protein